MSKKQFKPSTAAERAFMKALKSVARASSHIVEAHTIGASILPGLEESLQNYSKLIEPWAKRQAKKMLEKVSRSNRTNYQRAANIRLARKNSVEIATLLKAQVAEGEVGRVASTLMDEQADLIKSIPLKAGLRAQQLARQAIYQGTRAGDVAKIIEEMDRAGEVSESQAMCIARTEVARANSAITQARASAVGSTHYRWRNSGDEAVRHSHYLFKGKKLDGMIFSWAKPPTLDDGMTGHPGTFPNCRCYPEPVFPNE